MNNFWRKLLGIDVSPGAEWGRDVRLEFASPPQGLSVLWAIAASVALVVLVHWLYRREGRELSLRARIALASLRLFSLSMVGVMMLEPVLIARQQETVPSQLLLVLDDSESMRFSDPYSDETQAAAIAADLQLESQGDKSPVERLRETPRLDLVRSVLTSQLEALGRGREIAVYHLRPEELSQQKNQFSTEQALEQIQPTRAVSPVGDAVRYVLNAHRGQPVAGLILATDGRVNAGEDPLRAGDLAARANVPLFILAAGSSEGPRNIRLADLEISPVIFVHDPVQLSVLAEAQGLKETQASVKLEQRINQGPWEEVGSQSIVVGEDGVLTRTTFRVTPKVVGQYEFRARVDDAGPELTLDDNVSTAHVRVVRQEIRVLLIAGAPSPELQFLRNALLRDDHVEFSTWLQHADPGYRQPGDRSLQRLPDERQLREYDVLLMIDPDMRPMGPQWPEWMTDFVGKLGGGLIFVAGELHSQQLFEESAASSPGQDWTRILPIVREPGLYRSDAEVRLSTQSTYALELTPIGRGDPVFEFHADPIRNRAILTSLPGMYWHFPVSRARPGATVLAVHGDPRMQNQYGRHVLLATQLYGPGRTVFIGFDSTYRWRYLSENYFDGFWARLVDRVGRSKALGGRFPFDVFLDKSAYRVGDKVSVGVRYTDPAAISEASQLTAEWEVSGRPAEPLLFESVPGNPELLTASFTAEQAGAYTVRIAPTAGGDLTGGVRVSTTTFRVEPPRREIDEPSLNRPLLDQLANHTGGQVFILPQAKDLASAISMREVTRTIETRDELWDAPLLFCLLTLCLTAEWILRKKCRLV